MRLWRLTGRRHISGNLLAGIGARDHGGRWNYPGTAAVYTSTSVALCALEIFVHMGSALVPYNHVLIAVDVPDDIFARAAVLNPRPPNWDQIPESDSARRAGTDWLRSRATALLRVPSVAVPHDSNYIINPVHPDTGHITASVLQEFRFDPRMFR